MKISKEARIGVLFAASLIILFTGFYFLKGADLFSDDASYTCYYDSIDGMLPSAAVEIRGMNVGHVTSFQLDGSKKVKVVISIRKKIMVPVGSTATIETDGLLGAKIMTLELGNSSDYIKPNGVIEGVEKDGLIDNLSDEVSPLIKTLTKTVSALDTVIAGITLIAGPENRGAIAASLKSINTTADNLAVLSAALGKESHEMGDIVHNANTFVGALAKNSDTINHMLSSLNKVSGQLAAAPIQKTVTELEQMSNQLSSVMTKINSGQGSLGLLVNDKNMYDNLNKTLVSLDKLVADLQTHPSRYVNVNIIGRKKS